MSFYAPTLSQLPNTVSEDDRSIICDHTDRPTDCGDDALCPSCTRRSYTYWGNLISQWKHSMPSNSTASHSAGFDHKFDRIIHYVLATNDLKDAGLHPPLGFYPRLSLIEGALGLNEQDTNIILQYCPQRPAPLVFAQWDSAEPPHIVPQLRRFLMDLSRSEDDHSGRDINAIHRHLGEAFIQVFFDPVLDEVEDGQHLKAFLGTTWIQHILSSDGFQDSDLSQVVRRLEMDMWFEWVFQEGWRNGVNDQSVASIDGVELVSTFAKAFTKVPDSHRSDNIEALDRHLTRFLNSHFVQDLDQRDTSKPNVGEEKVQPKPSQHPFRFISASFYLNTLHSDNLPLPSHLHLSRLQLINLLSFHDLEGSKGELERAYHLVLKDPSRTFEESAVRELWNEYPVLQITPDPRVDQIFRCESLFRVWKEGRRPAYVWRGKKETHEDLVVCAFEVLVYGGSASRPLLDGVFEYAMYTWSYHLSHSTPTRALISYVKRLTQALSEGRMTLHNYYCHHPSVVVNWLEGAYNQFPSTDVDELLLKWRRMLCINANQDGYAAIPSQNTNTGITVAFASAATVSIPCTPPRKLQSVDRTKKKERPSPYAKTKVTNKKRNDFAAVHEEWD